MYGETAEMNYVEHFQMGMIAVTTEISHISVYVGSCWILKVQVNFICFFIKANKLENMSSFSVTLQEYHVVSRVLLCYVFGGLCMFGPSAQFNLRFDGDTAVTNNPFCCFSVFCFCDC